MRTTAYTTERTTVLSARKRCHRGAHQAKGICQTLALIRENTERERYTPMVNLVNAENEPDRSGTQVAPVLQCVAQP